MIALNELTVQDVFRIDQSPSLILRPDDSFAQAIERFARLPDLRGIFVVDAGDHLLGVITRADLLDWARVRLDMALQTPLGDADKTLRLVSLIGASTAGQVMHPDSQKAGIMPGDSLAQALRQMIELNLIVLPVVDEEGRLLGDLKLSELLTVVLNRNGAAGQA